MKKQNTPKHPGRRVESATCGGHLEIQWRDHQTWRWDSKSQGATGCNRNLARRDETKAVGLIQVVGCWWRMGSFLVDVMCEFEWFFVLSLWQLSMGRMSRMKLSNLKDSGCEHFFRDGIFLKAIKYCNCRYHGKNWPLARKRRWLSRRSWRRVCLSTSPGVSATHALAFATIVNVQQASTTQPISIPIYHCLPVTIFFPKQGLPSV